VRAGVAELQGDDPLREVAVVVPPGPAAIALRRALPRHGADGAGVAAAVVTTAIDLAHRLARPVLAERRPVTRAVQLAAARQALGAGRRSPALERVREHPATLDAVADLIGELGPLSWCTPAEAAEARVALTGGRSVAAELVEVAQRARTLLLDAGYRDEALLLSTAADCVAAHESPLVLALADELPPMQCRFLATLVDHLGPDRVRVVVPSVPGGDEALERFVTRLGGTGASAVQAPSPEAVAPRIVSLPDADEECRHAVRHVVGLVESGVPLDRIVVVHPPGTPPHARSLRDELTRAGVAWHGRAAGDLAGTVAGQVLGILLDLLDPAGDGIGRARLFSLLALAPVTPGFRAGAPVARARPVARWEASARRLGLVTDADWAVAADRLEDRQVAERDRELPDDDRARLLERHQRELRALGGLLRYVADLRDDLGAVADAGDWKAAAAALRAAWHRQIGTDAWRRVRWEAAGVPILQRRAAERVRRSFEALAELDRLGEPYDVAALCRSMRALLTGSAGPASASAAGVLVTSLAEAGLLDVDHAVVVGMNDGLVPPRPRQGLLVPSGPLFAGPELPVRRAQRSFGLLTSGVPQVLVTWARSDLRQGGLRFPSPWLADDGMPVASHAAGVLGIGDDAPAMWLTPAEQLARRAAGVDLAEVAAVVGSVPTGHRRAGALVARLGPARGPHDGEVGSGAVPLPAAGVSATWLETYAKCPFDHFVRYGLGVREVDEPTEIDDPTPRERGSLVHAVLADLVTDWLAQPEPRPAWPAGALARAAAVLDRHAEAVRSQGLLGHPAIWSIRRARLLEAVERALEDDRAAGRTPHAAEFGFGLPGAAAGPLELTTGDGTVVLVRGAIDRLERAADGTAVVVDFKTGKPNRFRITADDPTDAGRRLQLPLYGLVAARDLGVPVEQVTVQYRFVGERGGGEAATMTIDRTLLESVHAAVQAVLDGVAAGRFAPAEPTDRGLIGWDCASCVPDGLGAGELAERARRAVEEAS
jgi:RecB family exonuclease